MPLDLGRRVGTRPLRYCIVTSAHLCNNPRVVKEADALHERGHEVRVVAFDFDPALARRDADMMAERRWDLETVRIGPHRAPPAQWAPDRIAGRLGRQAFAAGIGADCVYRRAVGSYGWRLAGPAASKPADLVIGHNLQALPAAAWAAERLGTKLGFDFEDLHSEEHPDVPAHRAARQLAVAVERRYLARCSSITASSEGIAEAVVRLYGVPRPTVVLNAFLPEPTTGSAPQEERRSDLPSLYWYSQMIGPGRGLEDVIDAVPHIGTPVQVHLRGHSESAYEGVLRKRAKEAGVAEHLYMHELVAPDELVRRAGQHDIGLALEQPVSVNRSLCVTNKILTYLVAGLAVAATDTVGQREVLAAADGAGFLYPSGDPQALARGIRALLNEPGALSRAKERAAAAAHGPLSWPHQKQRLIRCLEVAARDFEPDALAESRRDPIQAGAGPVT